MEFAAETLLASTIHRTLHAQGFTRSSSQAASVLTDLLSRYLTLLTSSAAKYATLCGRSGLLDARDLIEAMDDMGVSIDDLSNYYSSEGRDFMYLISRRREEDLAELRVQLQAGLERDSGVPAELEWRELPEDYDMDDDEHRIAMDFEEPLLGDDDDDNDIPPLPLIHGLPDHIPSFLPPFPIVAEPELEDLDSTLMPPPSVPLPNANMPTLPSQTLTSTSTSAKDYLVRNQYELSSLSSTPVWHLPSDTMPILSVTKALPLIKQQKLAAANATVTPVRHNYEHATIGAYLRILQDAREHDESDLVPPSQAKHKMLLEMLFPSLSGSRFAGSLCDKWESSDTLYGTLASNAPRPPGGLGSGLSGTLPYPLGQHPSHDSVPKSVKLDPGKPDKWSADDKLLSTFPSPNPPDGRYTSSVGIGTGGDRVVGLVGHKVGVGRVSELARVTLSNPVRTRITRLSHPAPLYRSKGPTTCERIVHKAGYEAPWNSTWIPQVADKDGKKGKSKLSVNGSLGKKRKRNDDSDADEDDEYNSDESDGTKKKGKNKKGDGTGKKKIVDCRLWTTWEAELKDFRNGLTGIVPQQKVQSPMISLNGVGSRLSGQKSTGTKLTLGPGTLGRKLSVTPRLGGSTGRFG
ncbi:hypothetical protein DL96DRAFT_1618807 [Flagelloscypha sp. PMI_526]|nr:hypothetical protein DL96DRAFT_1618807 [Flagelloscypha sp. PMI_526]